VFAVSGIGVKNTKVNINYLKFDGGSEAIVNGILFTGQMSINDADVTIENSTFKNSLSDDGVNIKYSRVDIRNSKFIDNFSDQIDLDYCQATIFNNVFDYKKSNKKGVLINTDGLDISGSKVQATGNIFSNFSDKGISIGEGSNIMISGNEFKNNNLAIAIKDDSKAFIGKNQFHDNNIDISMYIKKKIYNNPNLYTIFKNKELNLKIESGDVFYMEDLQSVFQGVK
jgi:parallel beta-helix repeat protein